MLKPRLWTASRTNKGTEGQATVEFALTLVFLMAFILFFVQFSLVMAWGNYVHYATFMSARAYLSAGPGPGDSEQQTRARAVMERMVKKPGEPGQDRYPTIAKGVDGQDSGGDPVTGFTAQPPAEFDRTSFLSSWMEGVRYTFRSRIFMMPLAGRGPSSNGPSSVNSVTLTSESWLGRDPSAEECAQYMQQFGGVVDNGC